MVLIIIIIVIIVTIITTKKCLTVQCSFRLQKLHEIQSRADSIL